MLTDIFSSHSVIAPSQHKTRDEFSLLKTGMSHAESNIKEEIKEPSGGRQGSEKQSRGFIFFVSGCIRCGWGWHLIAAPCTSSGNAEERYQFHGKQMEIGCEKTPSRADKWLTKCEKPLRNSTFGSFSYCLIYLLHSL